MVSFHIELPEPAARLAAKIFETGLYGANIEVMFQTMVLEALQSERLEHPSESAAERLLAKLEPLLREMSAKNKKDE